MQNALIVRCSLDDPTLFAGRVFRPARWCRVVVGVRDTSELANRARELGIDTWTCTVSGCDPERTEGRRTVIMQAGHSVSVNAVTW